MLSRTSPIPFAVVCMAALLFAGPIHAMSPEETAKVEKLLDAIRSSDLTFIRGGTEYDAERAVEHLRMKWGQAGDRVETADEFIEHIASKSYLLGTPYRVKLPDGRQMNAGDWLRARLGEIERDSGGDTCCSISIE